MVSFPPCKINLGLQIISRRPDGYHDIATCFYPLPWSDIMEVLPSEVMGFATSGLAIPGTEADNLCLRAFHLLKKDFSLPPAQIHLHKILPIGAGLGGGSSDAAHTLRLLNEMFSLRLTTAQLMTYAASIGSDCAFFIQDQPMMGTGRGEILAPVRINLKGLFLVLINPGIHVSTAQAYSGVTPGVPARELSDLIEMPLTNWRNELKNDFETSVFRQHPAIQAIKESLYSSGALYASMSGSGSSVFGIFEKEADTESLLNGQEGWSGWL